MTDANARPHPPDEEVVRARRIEILDDSDRVRIEIGQLALPGTHEIRGFGITLRGPNGSVRADLTEDASGARLAFLSAGTAALELGAEDANTLMLDRGGDDLVYLPAGSPGNEVMQSGAYVIFEDAEGAPAFGWRVDPDGSVEPVETDGADAADGTAGGEEQPAEKLSFAGWPTKCCPEPPGGCPACALAEHFLNTLLRAAAHQH